MEHGTSPNLDRPKITKLKVFQTNGYANDGKQTTTNSGNGRALDDAKEQ
jgi:hypothetical protein